MIRGFAFHRYQDVLGRELRTHVCLRSKMNGDFANRLVGSVVFALSYIKRIFKPADGDPMYINCRPRQLDDTQGARATTWICGYSVSWGIRAEGVLY